MIARPSTEILNVPGGSAASSASALGLITAWFAFVLSTLSLYLILSEHQPVSTANLICSVASLWVCAFPVWRFYMHPERSIAYMPFVGIVYTLYFVEPIFSSKTFYPRFSNIPYLGFEPVEYASELVLLGLVTLMLGAFATRSWLRPLARVRREIDLERALPTLLFAAVVGFSLRLIFMSSGYNGSGIQFVVAVQRLGEASLAAILIAWLRGVAGWTYKAALVVLLTANIGLGLATSLMWEAALPILGLLLAYSWERRRIPWMLLLFLAAAFAPFQATKSQFRAANTRPDAVSLPHSVGLLGNFVETTFDRLSSGSITADEVQETSEARNNMMAMMTVVSDETPRSVPYWDGYTYSDALWHLIPRVVVPDKPAPSLGQEFPRRYGIIAYENATTSFNLPMIVECYVNYGPVGVAVGMFLIGLLCAALEYSLSASLGGALIGACLLSQLLIVESNFVLMFGAVPYMFLAVYLFLRVLPCTPKPTPAVREAVV
jgi:hypothetical protein